MKFKTTNYTGTKEILKFPDPYVAVGVMVESDGIVANADGKKIVPAGTIVGGVGGKVLDDNTRTVEKKNTQGATAGTAGAAVDAEGVLLSDVDVTYGDAPGAMVIFGFIDKNKLPEVPAADAVAALKGIWFMD